MAKQPLIFLDDGGVMNDNRARGPEWQRLVGEFFTPRLGGEPSTWAKANHIVATSIFEPESWLARVQTDYVHFERAYWRDWLDGMCRLVGIPTPPEEVCLDLAREAETYITLRVRSAFPGAVEAIRALHARGYELHTASGEPSFHLNGYLTGMGVRACFGQLYGTDLINTLKATPAYYERLFADIGIAPRDALIVDDSPGPLAWARDCGALTVLVTAERGTVDGFHCIHSLADLPDFIQQIC